MKAIRSCSYSLVVLALLAILFTGPAFANEEALARQAEQAGELRTALSHYVSALQTTTEGSARDYQLRERIITLAQKIRPLPVVPEEARRHLARGRAAVKAAKDEQGFMRAAEEFKEALRSAPWLSEGYYNLGVVLDKAARHDQAILNLKLYLASAPDDAQQVQDLIYEIGFRKEEALRTEREAREKLARRKEEMLGRLEGRWVERFIYDGKLDREIFHQLTRTGNSTFEMSYSYFKNYSPGEFIPAQKYYIKLSIDGNKLRGTGYSQTSPKTGKCKHHPVVERPVSGSISEDWRTITLVDAPYQYWNPFTCQWSFYKGGDESVFEKK